MRFDMASDTTPWKGVMFVRSADLHRPNLIERLQENDVLLYDTGCPLTMIPTLSATCSWLPLWAFLVSSHHVVFTMTDITMYTWSHPVYSEVRHTRVTTTDPTDFIIPSTISFWSYQILSYKHKLLILASYRVQTKRTRKSSWKNFEHAHMAPTTSGAKQLKIQATEEPRPRYSAMPVAPVFPVRPYLHVSTLFWGKSSMGCASPYGLSWH
jgi:hypothetical protein